MIKQTLSNYGIGGSEIGAIAGLDPYRAPIDIWRRKLGLDDTTPTPARDFAYWGHKLESPIREEYALRHGVEIIVPPESIFHPVHKWARATPDGIVVENGNPAWLVQIKTAGAPSAAQWEGNAIPPKYEAQVQWEMLVADHSRCDIAVLIGGNNYQERVVERDDKVIASLLEIAQDFMSCVERRIAPPPDATESYRRHLEASMGDRNDDVMMDATPELEIAVRELRETRESGEILSDREALLRNQITSALLAAGATALQSSQGKITWRAAKGTRRIDWQAACDTLASMFAEATSSSKERVLELVRKQHELTSAGARRFVVPRSWGAL